MTKQLGYGDYLRFRDLVLRQSGLHFPEKKQHDLAHGLFKALESRPQFRGNLSAYYRFLERSDSIESRAELDRLINLLTIGETHFFRHQSQFEALSNHVLPAMLAQKRAAAKAAGSRTPQLRLWSAGCATGEEAYSLAMLLRESIPDLDKWQVLILGTDINGDSLTLARRAVYSDWSFREPTARALRSIYFNKTEEGYQLRDEIRQMVTFAQHNLIEDDFPAAANNTMAMDLVMCRNVTIYFSEQTTRQLVKKFHTTLNNQGWLIVGHSEPSLFTYHDFQVHNVPGAILYQKQAQPSGRANASLPESKGRSFPTVDPAAKSDEKQTLPAESRQPSPLSLSRRAVQTRPKPPRRTDLLSLTETESVDSWHLDPYRSARALLSQGHIERAIVTLQGAMHVFSPRQRPYACCLLARAYADQGDWSQARLWSVKAIQLDTLLVEAYLILAMVEEQDNQIEAAIANLKKAIYLEREQPLAQFHLATLYKKQGKTAQASRALSNSEKILAAMPADQIIPDSGETRAGKLLATVRQMQQQSQQARLKE